jgi:hypothetical protein
MLIIKQKFQSIILFAASVLCVLLLAISFWNQSLKTNIRFGLWPVFFLLLGLIFIFVFFILHLRAVDQEKLNRIIQKKVTEERLKILAEFEKKEEIKADSKIESDLIAEKIVPSGNFKTEEAFAKKLLLNLSEKLQASIGIFYVLDQKSKKYHFLTGFALPADTSPSAFKSGENLNGQVAESKQLMTIKNIPEDYFTIESGMGKSKPSNLIIAPIVNNNRTIAIVEIATFIDTDAKLEKTVIEVCTLAAKKLEQIHRS